MSNLQTYLEAQKQVAALRRKAGLAAEPDSLNPDSKIKIASIDDCLGLSPDELAEIMAEIRPVSHADRG